MKHICFLSATHPWNDTRVLLKEAASLAGGGYRITHIAPGDAAAPGSVGGVRIVTFPTGSRLTRIRRLFAVARVEKADAWHCNELESWLVGVILRLLGRRCRVVFDVHEHYPGLFDDRRFPAWTRVFGPSLIRLYMRILTPLTDFFILAKRSIAADIRVQADRREFIFNYATTSPLATDQQELNDTLERDFAGGPVAVHVGAISRSRGWPQLLRALASMSHKDMTVSLFGTVDEGGEVLLREARRLGVESRIRLRDRIPFDQMRLYFRRCRFGLMLYQPGLTNHVFAFPMKMYDYMGEGLCFIGPDFAIEVTPVVQKWRCGILIDTASPEELTAAMDRLLDNPKEAREMGQRGQEAILTEYNWLTEEQKLLAVYERLLA